MSKALQKHIVSHLPEGAEGNKEDSTAKAQVKKNDGKKTLHLTDMSFLVQTEISEHLFHGLQS